MKFRWFKASCCGGLFNYFSPFRRAQLSKQPKRANYAVILFFALGRADAHYYFTSVALTPGYITTRWESTPRRPTPRGVKCAVPRLRTYVLTVF